MAGEYSFSGLPEGRYSLSVSGPRATAELRAAVQRAAKQGDTVLIVPLLISYGGVEAGIRSG